MYHALLLFGIPPWVITLIVHVNFHMPIWAIIPNYVLALFAWFASWTIASLAHDKSTSSDMPLFYQRSTGDQITVTFAVFCIAVLIVTALLLLVEAFL